MSTNSQQLLKSFDLLPEVEKRQVASEIIRRTLALDQKIQLDENQLETLYASFSEEDRQLAEEGMDDYVQGLAAEDSR
jgi:hypothetical protein